MDIKNNLESMLIINRKQDVATLYTEIEYEIELKNNLKVEMNSLTIPIVIPEDTRYVENSLYINGEIYNIGDNKSFRIPSFPINGAINISYKVCVENIPKNGAINNLIVISYIDNVNKDIINEISSNRVSTNVKGAKIEVNKNLDNEDLYVNEKIVQRINIINKGNVKAVNLVLEELIPQNILIESIEVDGDKLIGIRDYKSIPIGILEPLRNIKIIWYGKIIGVNNQCENLKTKIIYSYFDDYTNKYIYGNEAESSILINVKQGYMGAKDNGYKSLTIDKNKSLISEDVQMQFLAYNIGNVNVEDVNIIIERTAGIFIKELSLNGNYIKGENINLLKKMQVKQIEVNKELIIKGIVSVNSLEVEENKFNIIVEYKYFHEKKNQLVDNIYKSNEVSIKSYGVILENPSGGLLNKECSKFVCKIGDKVEYRIRVKNSGNISCNKLIFKEEENVNSEFIQESFKINNKPIIKADIYKGILIGDVDVDKEIVIEYNMKAISSLGSNLLMSSSRFEYIDGIHDGTSMKKGIEVNYNNTRIINPMLVEKKHINETFHYKKLDVIPYNIELENIGNIDLDDIEIHFNKSKDLEFKKISINGEDVDLKTICDNLIHIGNINSLEKNKILKLEMLLGIKSDSISEDVKISGEVIYSHIRVEGIDKESSTLNLQAKRYKITNGDFKGTIIAKKKGSTKGQEIDVEAEIVIDNIGNAELYNIEIIPHKDNTIEIIDGNAINKDCIPNIIESNEKIVIPIKFKASENYKGNIFKFASDLKAKYKFNEEDIEINKCVEEVQIELVDECLKCDINSNKNSFIIGDKAYFNITINNMGSHVLKDAFLQINIPTEIDIIEEKIYIRDKAYNYKDIIKGINLEKIDINEIIDIKYSAIINKIGLNKEINTYYKIDGYYNIDIGSQRIYKEYYSEILKNRIEKVNATVFLKADKQLLLNGDDIKFTTTIINDGTIPIDIEYMLDIGIELEEVTELRKLNGENTVDCNSKLSIEPNDGIVIEKTYIYKKFRGISNILSQGTINLYYKILDNNYTGHKEIKTEVLEIEITNTSFKELIIEEVIDIKKIDPIIGEIINIYITPTITSQNIRKVKRDYEYSLSDITGYRLEFIGNLGYTIEYVSKENNSGIYLISKDIIFASNIILPQDFIIGEEVEIKPRILNISHKIIEESRLFININLLVNTSI